MLRECVGLLVALVGCYSPSYVDCAITCPDGLTCPSGYVCEPSLKVCRPEGASGSCPTAGGDAGRDAVSGDGGDAQFGAFCSGLGTSASFRYCQDFDSGSLQDQGWMVTQAFSGTAALVTPGFSTPRQFESAVPASSEPAEGSVTDSFPVLGAFDQLSIHFEMEQALRTAGGQKRVFSATVGNATIELYSDGPGALSAQSYGVVYQIFDPIPSGWVHYELRFNAAVSVDAGAEMLDVSLYANGASLGSFGQIPVPPLATPWVMRFGLAGGGNNNALRFNYDNVVVY